MTAPKQNTVTVDSTELPRVTRVPLTQGFVAKVDGRNIWVGLFRDEIEAARAYDAAARQHFGEYCYQNFPL